MRLLYISKILTNAGWGAETFMRAALQNCGVDTICVDFDQSQYRLAQTLLKVAEPFDALLLQRGVGYSIPAGVLRAVRVPKFLLFTELIARNPGQHYLFQKDLFQHVFLRSGVCIRWVLHEAGVKENQVSLVLGSIDPEIWRPLPSESQDIDVLFVGHPTPRRQSVIQELQASLNVSTAQVFGDSLRALYGRAKVILNIHAEDYLDTETRVYEVLGCRGCLVSERLSPDSPFISGVHLLEAEDRDDLRVKIVAALENEAMRSAMAERGYQEVVQHHTYVARARQLIETMDPYLHGNCTGDALDREQLRRMIPVERSRRIWDTTVRYMRLRLGKVRRHILRQSLPWPTS